MGRFPSGASSYGVLDMVDNVGEWVADWYGGNYYASSPSRNPKGPDSGEYRLVRGGSWYYDRFSARAADRGRDAPAGWDGDVGFRCAQDSR
ncbi:MAG: SUMF1/EgtB/PvdO family nonheme iron enzyme [Candidatus Tectomicrobia bacterium]|uniref:SUMF1/EgtB/PvdO family nonheme iron enzyme n=1 Tax=Tectimicrobiota bacterium TaxID=2528274 RepID=A0A932CNK6_UNCTE|nr:SUMF1/EgtB/PvdO family nonheme iron enzyme [Candidatus Tectomicrobia bacterium]